MCLCWKTFQHFTFLFFTVFYQIRTVFALLFSLRHYDLLRQRGCVGSASGHIIRALCFALYQHQNLIEPWVRCLCCRAQKAYCNPCSIVLTRAANIVSGGLALKILTCWFNVDWNEKNPPPAKKRTRSRYFSAQRQSFHSNTVCSIGTAIMLMRKAMLLKWFVSVMGRS